MNFWHRSFYILSIIPWIFAVPLVVFFFHAWGILGYPPSYSHPDPKELAVYDFYAPVIYIGYTAAAITMFLIPALVPVYLFLSRKNINWKPIIAYSVSYAIGALLFFSELLEWFVD